MLSKQKFKSMIKSACKEACFQHLLTEKNKLGKGSEIKYSKLETQNYLKPGNDLSIEIMRRIYHTRCREIDLKCNFPSRFSDKRCLSPCKDGQDREQHIFLCKYFSNQNELSFPNIKF